jgi:hypothetical protein
LPGRTPNEAVESYTSPIQESLGCILQGRLTRGSDPASPEPAIHFLSLNFNQPTPLNGFPELFLRFLQNYQVIDTGEPGRRRYKVVTLGYQYSLETTDRRELLIYQWDPRGTGGTTRPHLHVGRRLLQERIVVGERRYELPKFHIPTGRVAIEDVVRFAITEMDVTPRRTDWETVLDRNQTNFEQWKSW